MKSAQKHLLERHPPANADPTEAVMAYHANRRSRAHQDEVLALRSYLYQIAPYLAQYGQALRAISQLAVDPQPHEPAWYARLAAELRAVQAAHEAMAQAKSVPKMIRRPHAVIVEGSGELTRAIEGLLTTSRQNADGLKQTADLIQQSAARLRDAMDTMEARIARSR